MDVLSVCRLTKSFRGFRAVDDISFSLREGEILGLLGPNGAGKTTTIQMLLSVLTPTSGTIQYFGKDLAEHREEILEHVNFSSTYTNLPWDLTVKENLTFVSYLYDIPQRKKRLEKIASIFRLSSLLSKPVNDLSAGQVTRVNLAKAFVNFPKVLLLDEPTASLDPDIAAYVREFLQSERKQFNVSIILTSHNMAEVEEVCDRVVFINKGKIIASDTPEQLAKSIEISHVSLMVEKGLTELEALCKEKGITYQKEGRFVIVDILEKNIPSFLASLPSRNVFYSEISIKKPTLHDYFLHMAKESGTHPDER